MTLVNLTATQINNALRQSGFSLGPSQFTFSIPQQRSIWTGYAAGSEPFTDYSTFDAAAAGHFRNAIRLWDALIAPDFAETADNGATRGEVRVAYTSIASGGGYAYSGTPTTPGGRAGDIWVDSAYVGDDFSPGNGNGLFSLLLHEIGHTLGLKHPFETPTLPAAYDNERFTVMSYSVPGWAVSFTSGAGSIFSSTEPVSAVTPMVLDIAAAQAIYGAETATATGDDVYQFVENEVAVRSIYDAGGIDTIDLANFMRRVDIDLRPGSYSSIGIFTRAEQIAYWTATVGSAGFVSNTINSVADLFTFTDNLGIAFATVIENATGGSGNDTLLGNDVANILRGGAGNDSLNGGLGADSLYGGTGTDSLYGGTGDDQYFVDVQGDLIFESAGEGNDTVTASAGYYLFANVENLVLDAAAGNIFGVGNAAANTITGNAGSNLLIGGGGDDSVNGGSGVDSLFGESGNDTLSGGAGIDYLVGGIGNDTLNGDADPDALYGEDGDDTLTGGSDFQTDILVGGDGNDTLNGASGLGDYDVMDGGAGNDSYQVDTPNDLTFEAAGGGTDTVIATIVGAGYYLYAFTENLILGGTTPFGVGNELANQLTGNAIGNYLLGGLGDDQLNGKGGSDVLFGEGGADIFQFERGTGGDVIGDFLAGIDKIKLTGLGFANFGQLQAGFVENAGTTAINLGQGDFIVLNGVANAQLSAVDFLFG